MKDSDETQSVQVQSQKHNVLKGFARCRQPLELYCSQYVCRGLSLNGFPGQAFIVFDDFGDPSRALEDLGGFLHHSN